MFSLHLTGSSAKDIRKLPLQLQEQVVNKFLPQIQAEPFACERLKGCRKKISKYKFNYKGKDYRIAFEIRESEKVILILMIGSRENFYDRLSRRKI